MPDDPHILIDDVDPAIRTITLNRPAKRNALNIRLIESVAGAIESAGLAPDRRAVLLRGAGPVFCAGLDLGEAAIPALSERSAQALAGLYLAMVRSPLVIIGVAQGGAFGGGVGLVAACDLVVASDGLKIGFPEVRRGLVAALITALLRRQMGDRAARELILLAQTISAPRARELGLVNRIVPAGELESAAGEMVGEIVKGAPGAMRRTKRLLDELCARPIEDDLRIAMRYHMEARDSREAAEGIAAFREKREPSWGPPRLDQ